MFVCTPTADQEINFFLAEWLVRLLPFDLKVLGSNRAGKWKVIKFS